MPTRAYVGDDYELWESSWRGSPEPWRIFERRALSLHFVRGFGSERQAIDWLRTHYHQSGRALPAIERVQ